MYFLRMALCAAFFKDMPKNTANVLQMSKNRMALPNPIPCNCLMSYRKPTSLQNVALNTSYN